MTRICVFGAGSIGAYLAAALTDAGAEVCVIARGAHLEAIQSRGLTLRINGEEKTYQLKASDNTAELGPQHYVFIAVKAHAVPPIVHQFEPLLGPDTTIVPAVNGLPWWYFYRANTGTSLDDTWLESVDPGGAQWHTLTPQRVIGCAVYPACEMVEPGVIQHLSGDRFTLGEPSGESTPRLAKLSELMIAGGLKAPRKPRIRDEIWVKLWGNCSFNPVSALTGATLDQIGNDRSCRAVIRAMMTECQQIGEAVGARFSIDIEKRIDGGAAITGHKPSTRQDFERGRPLELDALITVLQELGRRLGIETPALDTVSALARMQGKAANLYQQRPDLESVLFGD